MIGAPTYEQYVYRLASEQGPYVIEDINNNIDLIAKEARLAAEEHSSGLTKVYLEVLCTSMSIDGKHEVAERESVFKALKYTTMKIGDAVALVKILDESLRYLHNHCSILFQKGQEISGGNPLIVKGSLVDLTEKVK